MKFSIIAYSIQTVTPLSSPLGFQSTAARRNKNDPFCSDRSFFVGFHFKRGSGVWFTLSK